MAPTTPNGTRTCDTERPLGRTLPRTVWPTGSVSAATSRTASAREAIRFESRRSRSLRAGESPFRSPAARSCSFAARMRSAPASRAEAIASSPRFLISDFWVASCREARFAAARRSVRPREVDAPDMAKSLERRLAPQGVEPGADRLAAEARRDVPGGGEQDSCAGVGGVPGGGDLGGRSPGPDAGADRADDDPVERIPVRNVVDADGARLLWRPRVEGVHVAQQHEQVGPDQRRDERGQPVVVAEADLVS